MYICAGTLPTWTLPQYLQWFNLASNLLTGTIPASWMLPTTLGNPNLGDRQNFLGLHGNALSGELHLSYKCVQLVFSLLRPLSDDAL